MKFAARLMLGLFLSGLVQANEPWKGVPRTQKFQIGAINGIGVSGNNSGYTILGTGAIIIDEAGLVDDVTDQLWLEIQGGPFIVSGGTGSMFNTIVRWDFTYDEDWVAYGFGGLTHFFRPSTMSGGWEPHLHFGVGGRYYVNDNVYVRADVSYSLVAVGFGIPF